MSGFSIKNLIGLIGVVSLLITTNSAFTQGILRKNGLGTRFGLWKTARSASLISVSGSKIEVGGAGAWLYFFSRFNNEWFYEFHLGSFASVIVHNESGSFDDFVVDSEDVTAIIPFLFGMRYDFLATHSQSALQPYFSFGAGPYWITNVDQPFSNNDTFTGTVDSGLKPGAYAGAGMNLALASWLALNFDLKYHFVDFQYDQDFSGMDFGFGLTFMSGQKREMVRVLGVKTIVSDIYPAYYQFYNLYPLAMVSVKNMTGSIIEVNIRSNIRYFSERPKDTGYIKIPGKKTVDIPINAIFGPKIRSVKKRENAVIDITVEARAGANITKRLSSFVMVHNPNSWNGEIDKLVFFVNSDDERILNWGRNLVTDLQLEHDSQLRNFTVAKAVFEKLSESGFRYHSDPNIPFYRDDRVQFADETLDLKSGDCDDLVVLYASLLESLGINTAFVEVRDPEKELAHLYLVFDSGISAEQGVLISSNEKRYLMKNNKIGQQTVWIPVETTLIQEGFEEAWKVGALEYLQEGYIRSGLAEGWVKVIDVE